MFLNFFITEAGGAFCEAAKIKLNQLENKHEAGTQFVEAGNCYRKCDFSGEFEFLQFCKL